MSSQLDDPVIRRRTVRNLLVVTPFLFVGGMALAWVQGARTDHALLIASIGAAMALSAALVIHLMGSKSTWVLVAVRALLSLVRR